MPVWVLLTSGIFMAWFLPAAMGGAHAPGLPGSVSSSLVTRAALVTALFLSFFIVGWRSGTSRREAPAGDPDKDCAPFRTPRLRILLAVQFACIAVGASVYALSGIGLSAALTTVSDLGYDTSSAGQLRLQFLTLIGNFGLIVMPSVVLAASRWSASRSVRVLAVLNVVGVAVLVGFMGVRFRLVLLLCSSVLVWYLARRRIRGLERGGLQLQTFVVLAALLSVLIPLGATIGQERSAYSRDRPISDSPSVTSDMDLLTPAAATVGWVESNGILWAAPIIDVPSQFVPRALWPEKPTRASTLAVVDSFSVGRVGCGDPDGRRGLPGIWDCWWGAGGTATWIPCGSLRGSSKGR